MILKTLNDIPGTLIPQSLGLCDNDLTSLAKYLNEAIPNLLQDRAAGDTGFFGTTRRVVFNVDPLAPYISLPREIARLANLDICRTPVRISNEWYEMMEAGPGLRDLSVCDCSRVTCCSPMAVYDRGTSPTAFNLTTTNKLIRVYYTDSRDVGRRVLISKAVDQNGNRIYTQDAQNPVDGFYLSLTNPFATSAFVVTAFQAVIKDATFGDVLLKEVDATTGVESLLARYAPDELNPSYRVYFIDGLPKYPVDPPTVPATYKTRQVTAMAKLEFIPLVRGTDFLLIGNPSALRAECESIRYSKHDNPESQAMSLLKHKLAIKHLRDEVIHYFGNQQPSITQPIAGLEGMACQKIGSLI